MTNSDLMLKIVQEKLAYLEKDRNRLLDKAIEHKNDRIVGAYISKANELVSQISLLREILDDYEDLSNN